MTCILLVASLNRKHLGARQPRRRRARRAEAFSMKAGDYTSTGIR